MTRVRSAHGHQASIRTPVSSFIFSRPSTSIPVRILWAFLPSFLTIIALSAHRASSSSSCSPVSFDQISSDPLPRTYLCPPALSHAFDLGIVLWFHVALVHSCVSICSPSLSFFTSHQPGQLVMNQAELQTAVIAECTKHKEQNSQNADSRACVDIGTEYFVKYGVRRDLEPERATQDFIFTHAQ